MAVAQPSSRPSAARRLAPIRRVLADGEFDSERNHAFIRQVMGADSIIPAKRGKKTWHLHGVQAQMRTDFPIAPYRQQALLMNAAQVRAGATHPCDVGMIARVPNRLTHTDVSCPRRVRSGSWRRSVYTRRHRSMDRASI